MSERAFNKRTDPRRVKRWKKPYRGARRFYVSCRCHGGCGWCLSNRLHKHERAAPPEVWRRGGEFPSDDPRKRQPTATATPPPEPQDLEPEEEECETASPTVPGSAV